MVILKSLEVRKSFQQYLQNAFFALALMLVMRFVIRYAVNPAKISTARSS